MSWRKYLKLNGLIYQTETNYIFLNFQRELSQSCDKKVTFGCTSIFTEGARIVLEGEIDIL